MTVKIEKRCDGCDRDLTIPTGYNGFNLVLELEREAVGDTVFAMHLYPPINSTKHFCGNGCLKKWAEKM
jgi:hypothetical protein